VFWWRLPSPQDGLREIQRKARREQRHANIAFEEELERRLALSGNGLEALSWIEEFQQPGQVPQAVAFENVEMLAEEGDAPPANEGDTPVADGGDAPLADQGDAPLPDEDAELSFGGSQEHQVIAQPDEHREMSSEPLLRQDKDTQCDFRAGYFDLHALRNPADLKVLTGVPDMTQFGLLMSMFKPAFTRQAAEKKRCSPQTLSSENKLLLTLTKLRHSTSFELLGTMFDVSATRAAAVFRDTVQLMYAVLRELNLWPQQYDQSLPVVIIDCTELKISRPSNPTLQSQTYSTYKSANTVKILIGITLKGAISFVSEAFSGSASDQQVFERSGLLELLREGDIVLADRGFNIQHLAATRGVTIVTPAFLKGRSQLLPAEVIQSRMITRQRIHVERLIGLTKTYKFVKGPIHYRHVPIISEVYFVACFLSNLQPAIVR